MKVIVDPVCIIAYNKQVIIITELDDEGEEEEEEGIMPHGIIHAEEDEVIEETPADCFPEHVYVRFPFLAGDDDAPFWQGWANLRLKTFQLIENKYFETAVITMILLSSLALVRYLKENFQIK